MKLLLTSLFLLALSFLTFAQIPQSFSYQAIARDASGNGIANQNIGLRISILQGSITGTSVYTETHVAPTDANGILNLAIGAGTPAAGTFAGIDWSTGTYFVKVEMDITGGNNYVLMGASQLLSVPYALYAGGVKLNKNNQPMDLYIGDDGGVYGKVKIVVEKPYSLAPTVTDIDGNVYSTVKIGTQVWMAENLRTTKYNDGTTIPYVTDATDWSNLTTPGRCAFNNNTTDTDSIKTFGLLYNGFAVQTNKLCPVGWHIPTKADLEIFMAYLGPLGGYRLKSDQHWSTDYNTINDAGFDAYEAGSRGYYYPSRFTWGDPSWWSSTLSPLSPNTMYSLQLSGNVTPVSSSLIIPNSPAVLGIPARCIKN
jgi:uncharacterized protein (TIGR02145 family)